jgi:PLP dependent protein
MTECAESLAERIDRVRGRVAAACARAGRSPDEVTLVAVSKTQPPEAVCAAAACGLRVFGENKVQEAGAKMPLCPSTLEWHLVGHLQSNKAKLAIRMFRLIHSVDSLALLERLHRLAEEEGGGVRALLEVNVAGEASKFGLPPGGVEAVLDGARAFFRVEVLGLMAIPPPTADVERARGHFRMLRELRDRLQSQSGYGLPELSMGMSHDFEMAIEEGATMVRVGTDIFGSRA